MKDREVIEIQISRFVSDILGEEVGVDGSRDTVSSWDSLRHVEIIFAFEESFGVRLREEEMANLRSIKDLAKRAKEAR